MNSAALVLQKSRNCGLGTPARLAAWPGFTHPVPHLVALHVETKCGAFRKPLQGCIILTLYPRAICRDFFAGECPSFVVLPLTVDFQIPLGKPFQPKAQAFDQPDESGIRRLISLRFTTPTISSILGCVADSCHLDRLDRRASGGLFMFQ